MHTTDPFILTYKNDSATCVFNWIFLTQSIKSPVNLKKKIFQTHTNYNFKKCDFLSNKPLSLSLLDNHTLLNTAT